MGILEKLKARKEPMVVPRGADLTATSDPEAAEDTAPARIDLGAGVVGDECLRNRAKACRSVRAAISAKAGESILETGTAGPVTLEVCRKMPGGSLATTGLVEGLKPGSAKIRHAYAHVFRCLEQAGLIACEWNLADGAKLPLLVRLDARDARRIGAFLDADAVLEEALAGRYDAAEGASASRAEQRRAAGRAIAKAFKAAAGEKRAAGSDIAIRVHSARRGDAAAHEAERAIGNRKYDLPDAAQCSKSTRPVWAHAFRAAEAEGLLSIAWLNRKGEQIPVTASCRPGDLPKLCAFFGVAGPAQKKAKTSKQGAEAQARKREEGESKASRPLPNPAEDSAERARKAALEAERARKRLEECGKMLADADSLLKAAQKTPSRELAEYLLAAAEALGEGDAAKAPKAIARARKAGLLPAIVALLLAYPSPADPPVEMRCASARALDDSKALDGAAGAALSAVLLESGAVPECPDPLRAWGLSRAGARAWIGGGFTVLQPEGPCDVSALPEGACVSCDFLDRAAGIDARGVRGLLVIENLAAFRQACRDLGGVATLLYVDGAMNGEQLAFARKLAEMLGVEVFGWYDVDSGGFQRFERLKSALGARPALMDLETIAGLGDSRLAKLEPGQRRALEEWLAKHPASEFAAVGRALLRRGRYLEQEALLDGYAQGELRRMLEALPKGVTRKGRHAGGAK